MLTSLSKTTYIVTFFVIFFLKFIEVQLIYNIVLISTVQQNDSVIHMYAFFSIMVYHRILNIVLCDVHEDLVVYPFYT